MNAVTEIRAAGSRDETFQQFEVTPATPILGAYITDLHLADISEPAAQELRQALWALWGPVSAQPAADASPTQQRGPSVWSPA